MWLSEAKAYEYPSSRTDQCPTVFVRHHWGTRLEHREATSLSLTNFRSKLERLVD